MQEARTSQWNESSKIKVFCTVIVWNKKNRIDSHELIKNNQTSIFFIFFLTFLKVYGTDTDTFCVFIVIHSNILMPLSTLSPKSDAPPRHTRS